ncbi:phosphotransferase [uncultured Amnibacterium sp.]|uniref:phosphotransferase n=1 Tax=uncultured Amnibacterium sp. TaxID=1631851 RepID=UPI0035CB41E7
MKTGSEDWHRRFQLLPPGEHPAPILSTLATGTPELVWRNELGGQTWSLGTRYLKWSPDEAGLDLHREVERMRWLLGRYPVPEVLDSGHDGRGGWMLTAALAGTSAVTPRWRAEPETAVRAIAGGLRGLHELDVTRFPSGWESWATRRPPALGPAPVDEPPVIVHGDACAPNTLVRADGGFAGIVDVGDLVLGDRWADLAVASMSLEWNFGPGWEPLFFDAYGIEPDDDRIAYFRRLWHAES